MAIELFCDRVLEPNRPLILSLNNTFLAKTLPPLRRNTKPLEDHVEDNSGVKGESLESYITWLHTSLPLGNAPICLSLFNQSRMSVLLKGGVLNWLSTAVFD